MRTANITVLRGGSGIALLAGCLLLAGCPGSKPLTANPAPAPYTTPVPSSAAPETRSILPIPETNIRNAVARLPGLVKKVMADTGIPGVAVAVVHDGKTVYAEGFGVRKEGESAPVTADTVFQVASVSKSIAGTVVARVVSQHMSAEAAAGGPPAPCTDVRWDTPVQCYLPDFTLGSPWVAAHVTVGDLLSHHSGLPGTFGDRLQALGFNRQQIFAHVAGLRPCPGTSSAEPCLGPFRKQYAYTNFGFTAGAVAVANAQGLDWASLAQQELFAPLGMNSSSYRYDDYLARANRAATHVKRDGRWQALYSFDDDAGAPAGGLSSTVKDLAQWMKLILADGEFNGRQLIQPAALLPALTPQATAHPANRPSTRTGFYGYGFDVQSGMSGRMLISHSGAFTSGAATAYEMIPSAGVGIVVLTNAFPIGAPETIASQFSDIVQYGAIRTDWPPLWHSRFAALDQPSTDCAGQSPPANPAPPQPDDAYTGNYTSSYFGDATVAVNDGQLTLTLGSKKLEYTLQHWNGDEFVIDLSEADDYPPGSLTSVWFTVDSGGNAARLAIGFLNGGSCSEPPGQPFSPYEANS